MALNIEKIDTFESNLSSHKTEKDNFKPEVITLINEAKLLTDGRQISAAMECYNDALDIEPFNVDALMNRASLHIQNDDFDKAKQDALTITKVEADNIQGQYILGVAYQAKKEYLESLDCYICAIGLDRNHLHSKMLTQSLMNLVMEICNDTANFGKKIDEWSAYKCICEAGVKCYRHKKFLLALKILDISHILDSNQVDVTMKIHHTMANCNLALDRVEMAISLYIELYSVACNSQDIHNTKKALVNIASIYLDQKNVHQALVYFNKLLDLKSDLQTLGEWTPQLAGSLHMNMSLAYKQVGDLQTAVRHAKKYVKVAGADLKVTADTTTLVTTPVTDHRTSKLTHLQLPESTIEQLQYEALELKRKRAANEHRIASEGHMIRDIDQWEKDHMKQEDLEKCDSLLNCGSLYELLGQFNDAIIYFEEYRKLCKNISYLKGVAKAYGKIGSIYASLGNGQLAKAYHEQYIKILNDSNDDMEKVFAYEQLGNTYTVLKDYENAINLFHNMYSACKDDDIRSRISALCKIGATYYLMGNDEQARIFYERARNRAKAYEIEVSEYRKDCENHHRILDKGQSFEDGDTLHRHVDISDLVLICEYNECMLLQNSTNYADLKHCRQLLDKIILSHETTIQKSYDENMFCSNEIREQLENCYLAIQRILININNKDECLVYTEMSRRQVMVSLLGSEGVQVNSCLSDTTKVPSQTEVDQYKITSIQEIQDIVDSQTATVISYSCLSDRLVIYLLTPQIPAVSYVHYLDVMTLDAKGATTLSFVLGALITAIRDQRDTRHLLSKSENRALPAANITTMSRETLTRARNSANEIKNNCGRCNEDGPPYFCKPHMPADRRLYEILFPPLISAALLNKPHGSPLVIVADRAAHGVPWATLRTRDDRTLSSIFRVTSQPSFYVMNIGIKCQKEMEQQRREILKARDASLCMAVVPVNSIPPSRRSGDVGGGNGTSRYPKSCQYDGEISGGPRVYGASTLTTRTSTNTDIVQSTSDVVDFRQFRLNDHITVIGCPDLPSELLIHGRKWNPTPDTQGAKQHECLKVANMLKVKPMLLSQFTRDAFVQELKTSTILHIVTLCCPDTGLIAFTPRLRNTANCPLPVEHQYTLSTNQIAAFDLTSVKLVVLSSGWSPVERALVNYAHPLATALLTAGVQNVLYLKWAIPDEALLLFYNTFYSELKLGKYISIAMNFALDTLRSNKVYEHLGYASAFQLMGIDCHVNIAEIQRYMLDEVIDTQETCIIQQSKIDPLNIGVLHSMAALDKEDKLNLVQYGIHDLVVGNTVQEASMIISELLEIIDIGIKRIQNKTIKQKSKSLSQSSVNCQGSVKLLLLLGFNFQTPSLTKNTIVVYPRDDQDKIFSSIYDCLIAINSLLDNPLCCDKLMQLFPLSQETISNVVDVLCVTKHASDIQLKVSDRSLRPLWRKEKMRSLFFSIGFQQIGTLVDFKNVPTNKKALSDILQFFICVSAHKSPILNYKLDIEQLGGPFSGKYGFFGRQ